MSEKLWEPRAMVKAFSPFNPDVNLRHITTRRERGLISPHIKAERAGCRNKYSTAAAVLYGLASYIESCGVGISDAYEGAYAIVTIGTCECLERTALDRGDLVLFRGESSVWCLFDLAEMKPLSETMRGDKFSLYINVSEAVNAVCRGLGLTMEDLEPLGWY